MKQPPLLTSNYRRDTFRNDNGASECVLYPRQLTTWPV
jgi:hypothetical protein